MKKLCALLLAALFAVSVLTACQSKQSSGSDEEKKSEAASYESGLFDTSYVHKINVEISEDDWKDLRENPLKKTKYSVDVTIDGDTVENVSFATKGNTSLSQVADSDSDRYSFKINFGKYEKGQTYQGLDKLNLNNIMSDATYMKDYLSYLIMRKAGVSASLTSYVELSINGEVHGLYIAIEDVSDSFLERNTGDDDGALYKPETDRLDNAGGASRDEAGKQLMPGGDNQQGNPPQMPSGDSQQGNPPQMPSGDNQQGNPPQMPGGDNQQGNPPQMPSGDSQQGNPPQMPSGDSQQGNFPQMPGGDSQQGNFPQMPDGGKGGMGGPGGFGGDAKGADLVYSDDSKDSYSDIFDNEENDVSEEDEQELIAAIKALSDGKDIDEHWDMDQVIRYFVAHNFVLNYDSYTGNMLHNYYLYESDGKVTVFPWDYNLAFGGFQGGGDSTTAINTAIDSPLSGADEDSRPLWKVIVSNESYLKLYHQYYSELMSSFFDSGDCEKEIERVYEMIRPYVKDDPSAFYKVEEFDEAVSTLKQFCTLRAQSINKQLNGELGSAASEQKKEDMVDASAITLSKMGQQGGRDDGGFKGFGRKDRTGNASGNNSSEPTTDSAQPSSAEPSAEASQKKQ